MGHVITYSHRATFPVQTSAEKCRGALEANGLLVAIDLDDAGWLLQGEHVVETDELQAAVASVGLIVARHSGAYVGGDLAYQDDDEDDGPDLAAFSVIAGAVHRAQPNSDDVRHGTEHGAEDEESGAPDLASQRRAS